MIDYMYPFWAALVGIISAQILKPLFLYVRTREWKPHLFIENGGFPSSHTSSVAALAMAVGIKEDFNSTIFAVTLLFSLIIAFDAANVRYYAGQNIQVTRQLIQDIQELTTLKFDDPIYETKLKEVLGHKWIEVIAGVIWGILIAIILSFMR